MYPLHGPPRASNRPDVHRCVCCVSATAFGERNRMRDASLQVWRAPAEVDRSYPPPCCHSMRPGTSDIAEIGTLSLSVDERSLLETVDCPSWQRWPLTDL